MLSLSSLTLSCKELKILVHAVTLFAEQRHAPHGHTSVVRGRRRRAGERERGMYGRRMIRHRDVGKSQRDSHLLSNLLQTFLNFLCVNLHIFFHASLYASYKGVVIICANRRLRLFPLFLSFPLYLTHTLPLSFLLSVSLLSCSKSFDL